MWPLLVSVKSSFFSSSLVFVSWKNEATFSSELHARGDRQQTIWAKACSRWDKCDFREIVKSVEPSWFQRKQPDTHWRPSSSTDLVKVEFLWCTRFKVGLKSCTCYLQNYTKRDKYPDSLHFGSRNHEQERFFGIALWRTEICWSVGALLPKLPVLYPAVTRRFMGTNRRGRVSIQQIYCSTCWVMFQVRWDPWNA